MLKKSLFWETAVLLLAVFFVFAGCEGPAGPAGESGQVGPSEIGDISVGVEIKQPEVILPNGFTYPDGAKVLAGNAEEIAKAFNGGVFVASDPDVGTGSTTASDYVYSQDGVDQVVWAGPPDGASGSLGAISVPPGKTLFIGAPLVISSGTGVAPAVYFEGISVLDQGSLPQASVQYANVPGKGGAKIDSTSKGALVVLAGGKITNADTAGVFSVGGNLEIHEGGAVAFSGGTPALIETTNGSVTTVFGELSTVGDAVIGGNLSINGRYGKVATGTSGIFSDVVEIKGFGNLTVGSGGASFYGTVNVVETASVYLTGDITIANEFTLNGGLSGGGNPFTSNITLWNNTASHLKIGPTARVSANAWNLFRYNGIGTGANDVVLLAALNEDSPSTDNYHITIATDSTKPAIYLDVGSVTATSYANFAELLKSETLHLRQVSYNLAAIPTADEIAANPLVIAKDNYGSFAGAAVITELGDITVQDGGALNLGTKAIATAGNVTVIGEGRPVIPALSGSTKVNALGANSATFATGLKSLTIGNTAGVKTLVSLTNANATLEGAKTNAADPSKNTVITVNKNAVLTLGTAAVNPGGDIVLVKGDEGKENGGELIVGANATFENLYKLDIGEGASFDGGVAPITFYNLVRLVVDGTLEVTAGTSSGLNSGSGADGFYRLQNIVDGTSTDPYVKGGGKAVFNGWAVSKAVNGHAYDQLRGIKHITVASVAGIPKISGTGETSDAQALSVLLADNNADASLTVTDASGIAIPEGGLTIDMNLYLQYDTATGGSAVASRIAGSAAILDNVITIGKGRGVYVYDIDSGTPAYLESVTPVLAGKGQEADTEFTLSVASPVLAANATKGITVTVSPIILSPTKTLVVPGELTTVGVNVGRNNDAIRLLTGTILKDVTLTSGPNVDADGIGTIIVRGALTIGTGTSTMGTIIPTGTGLTETRNKIELAKGGKIIGTLGTPSNILKLGAGAEFAQGTLEGNGTNNAVITATANTITTFTGAIKAYGSAGVLKGVAVNNLNIGATENDKISVEWNGYDYAELSNGAKLYGVVTFDATAGAATIFFNSSGTLTEGTIKTNGTGVLDIGGATLKAPNPIPLTAGTVLEYLSATGGTIRTGTLSLNDGSVLTIKDAGTLNVGTTTTAGTLEINANTTGKVVFGNNASSKLVVETDGTATGIVSHFKFGGYDIMSLDSSKSATAYATLPTGIKEGTPSPNDTFITSTGATSTAVAGTGSTLAITAGSPSIVGVAGNKTTITKDSKVFLGS
jgi:hypothetical protein